MSLVRRVPFDVWAAAVFVIGVGVAVISWWAFEGTGDE